MIQQRHTTSTATPTPCAAGENCCSCIHSRSCSGKIVSSNSRCSSHSNASEGKHRCRCQLPKVKACCTLGGEHARCPSAADADSTPAMMHEQQPPEQQKHCHHSFGSMSHAGNTAAADAVLVLLIACYRPGPTADVNAGSRCSALRRTLA